MRSTHSQSKDYRQTGRHEIDRPVGADCKMRYCKAGLMAQKPGPSMEFWRGVILCLVLVTAGRLLLIGL
jgi:hypothetical protein